MSSSNPNLQNIPKKQIYRSCFVAKPGYVLITSDMSGAELRILGNLSEDQIFIESYRNGIDLHTRTSSEIFDVPMEKVTGEMRNAAKAINFGLAYGLSKFGLAQRLKLTEDAAEDMIKKYFQRYKGIKKYLDRSARQAVVERFSRTVSGRKRYYNLPDYEHPDYKRMKASVEREAKNAPIQGANADTIKEAMIYIVDRLDKSGLDAKLLLTVHDEVIVESHVDHAVGARHLVEQAIKDGFGKYFHLIPMETDALSGPCWLKGKCEAPVDGKKCNGTEMLFVPDDKYKNKIICKKCGSAL
jgi:DNA polymerase-1